MRRHQHEVAIWIIVFCLLIACVFDGAENILGALSMLYLTAFVTVAALVYLVYAMLRPERF